MGEGDELTEVSGEESREETESYHGGAVANPNYVVGNIGDFHFDSDGRLVPPPPRPGLENKEWVQWVPDEGHEEEDFVFHDGIPEAYRRHEAREHEQPEHEQPEQGQPEQQLTIEQQYAQPATAAAANGDLNGFFGYLMQVPPPHLGLVLHGWDMTPDWGQVVDSFVEAHGQAFTAALDRSTPELMEALMSRGVINTVVRAYARPPDGWLPDEYEQGVITERNQRNVKALSDKQSTTFAVGGFAVLIGQNHEAEYVARMGEQLDSAEGRVQVRKAGAFDAGTLTFTGCPPAKQAIVEQEVARFSEKAVKFI